MNNKKIEVKLFAFLRDKHGKVVYLNLNTIREVLDFLKISDQEASIILVNGKVASKEKELNDGDVVSIFPQVGGG